MLALIVLGIILLAAAYTIDAMPSLLKQIFLFLGIICVAVPLVVLVIELVGTAGGRGWGWPRC